MLEELLRALRNWFVRDKATGRIRVEGGTLVPPRASRWRTASTSA